MATIYNCPFNVKIITVNTREFMKISEASPAAAVKLANPLVPALLVNINISEGRQLKLRLPELSMFYEDSYLYPY
jgi:hypothetical protein